MDSALTLPSAPLPPGPSNSLSVLRRLAVEPLELFQEGLATYGDVIRYRKLNKSTVMVLRPDGVERVLCSNASNYAKQTGSIKRLSKLAPFIAFDENPTAQRKRRLMNPAFRRTAIEAHSSAITETVEEHLNRWDGRQQETIDLSLEISELTLRVACRAFLGAEARLDEAIFDAIRVLLREWLYRSFRPLNAPLWVPIPYNRRFNRANAVMMELVHELLAQRRQDGSPGQDLLSIWLASLNRPEGLRSAELEEELKQFLVVAHETTATGILWSLYFLADAPEATSRLRSEVQDVVGSRHPRYADLAQLQWTQQVFNEALRLRSPTWLFPRRAIEADEIAGFRIPRGASVYLSPFLTHHHPEHWEDPTRFDPTRFDADKVATRHRHAFFPFGAGARQCIGSEFARMEASLFLAMFLRRFDYDVEHRDAIRCEAGTTLRPSSLRVRVSAR